MNAIFASLSLPFNASVSAYYALGWDRYRLDGEGTPFSNEDVVESRLWLQWQRKCSELPLRKSFRWLPSELRRNDSYSSGHDLLRRSGSGWVGIAQFANILPGPNGSYGFQVASNSPNAGVTRPNCGQSAFFDYATRNPTGQYEQTSLGQAAIELGDGVDGAAYQGVVTRGQDLYPRKTGDFGLNLKYLMDGGLLDGYEFGAYYQNYTSRLPYVSETTGSLQLGIATTGNSANVAGNFAAGFASQLAGRYAGTAGCGLVPGTANYGTFIDPRITFLKGVPMSDPQNLLNVNSVAQANQFLGSNVQAGAGFIDTANGGHNLAWDETHDFAGLATLGVHDANSVVNDAGGPPGAFYHTGIGAGALGKFASVGNAAELNCALGVLESGLVSGLPMNFNGSEYLYSYNQLGLSLEYPEGIEQYGFSFAGTIGTWGIQGEVSYRPNAPFQVDTDQLTIAAVTQECAFVAAGNLGADAFEPLNTMSINGHRVSCNPAAAGNSRISGVLFNDMWTGQIGSTATFTNSEWFIDAIGADLGIFVPEVGLVHVPGVESTWVDNNPTVTGLLGPGTTQYIGPTQYQNIGCQGSDLPLGGLLNLDHKSSKQCRPTDTSAGLVMLAVVQYANAFNSGFLLSPQAAFSWDFYGTTPAPYGNYLEGRKAVNLGVNGELNNNFHVGVNYTMYFGAGIANKAQDQDFAAASVSYSF